MTGETRTAVTRRGQGRENARARARLLRHALRIAHRPVRATLVPMFILIPWVAWAELRVEIIEPGPEDVVDATLDFAVRITSTFEVAQFVVSAPGQSAEINTGGQQGLQTGRFQ